MNLVTLAQAKRWLGIPPAMTDDDLLLKRLLLDAEQWAENTAHHAFKPIIETRTLDWCGSYELYFNDDLCELITVTNGDSALTVIPLTEFTYHPRRAYPKFGVTIKRGSDYIWEYNETPEDAISIKAVWCCHDDWGHAWVNSNDRIAATGGINAAETSITVTNVNGANAELDEPRFSIGMLIKIESEWMEVTDVSGATTDAITVTRGALGSTAATHAYNTVIYTFKPQRAVIGAIMAYVLWRYNQKNNRADYGNEVPADITALLPSPVGAYLGS